MISHQKMFIRFFYLSSIELMYENLRILASSGPLGVSILMVYWNRSRESFYFVYLTYILKFLRIFSRSSLLSRMPLDILSRSWPKLKVVVVSMSLGAFYDNWWSRVPPLAGFLDWGGTLWAGLGLFCSGCLEDLGGAKDGLGEDFY